MPGFNTVDFGNGQIRADQVLIQLDPGADLAALNQLAASIGHVGQRLTSSPAGEGDFYYFQVQTTAQLAQVLDGLARIPGVRRVEPDYVIRTANDLDDIGEDEPGGVDGGPLDE